MFSARYRTHISRCSTSVLVGLTEIIGFSTYVLAPRFPPLCTRLKISTYILASRFPPLCTSLKISTSKYLPQDFPPMYQPQDFHPCTSLKTSTYRCIDVLALRFHLCTCPKIFHQCTSLKISTFILAPRCTSPKIFHILCTSPKSFHLCTSLKISLIPGCVSSARRPPVTANSFTRC